MSEQNEDTLATEDIQARVDELLREIDAQAEAVEARMTDEQADEDGLSGPVGDQGELAESDLDDQVEKLIEQANPPEDGEPPADAARAQEATDDEETEAAEAPAAEAPTEEAAEDSSDDDELDEQVDEMLRKVASDDTDEETPESGAEPEGTRAIEETPEAPAETPSEDAAPTEPSTDVDSTEEDVEDAGEEALAKSLAGAADAPAADEESSPAEDEPAPEKAPEAQATSDALDEELAAEADQTLEGEIEAVELGEEVVAFGDDTDLPEETPETPTAGEAAADESTVAEAPSELPSETHPSGGASGPGVLARLVAAVVGVLHALSRPLDRLTARQRDTIGWVALNLLFIAVCVWLVILLR
jgi:hypothetical protein